MQSLYIYAYSVSDNGLKFITNGCPSLKSIEIRCSQRITNVGIAIITQQCKQLETIKLIACSFLTDEALHAIGQHCCTTLRTIDISQSQSFTDDGLSSLAKCTRLQTVTIMNCDQVTEAGILNLVSGCREITSMFLTAKNL